MHRLVFTDLMGNLKELWVNEVKSVAIDGSSLFGLSVKDSDLVLIPSNKIDNAIFCDISYPNGLIYKTPRSILKSLPSYNIGIELEFYLEDSDIEGDKLGYMDSYDETREEMVDALNFSGITVNKHHHEALDSQHEIVLEYADSLIMADRVILAKDIISKVAYKHEKEAIFDSTSGMHCHISYKGWNRLSAINSLQSKVNDMFLLVNPSGVLRSGKESPKHLKVSPGDRTSAIRIPPSFSDKDERIEFRLPDSTANPYLVIASIIKAIEMGDKPTSYELVKKGKDSKFIQSLLGRELNKEYLKKIRYKEIKAKR